MGTNNNNNPNQGQGSCITTGTCTTQTESYLILDLALNVTLDLALKPANHSSDHPPKPAGVCRTSVCHRYSFTNPNEGQGSCTASNTHRHCLWPSWTPCWTDALAPPRWIPAAAWPPEARPHPPFNGSNRERRPHQQQTTQQDCQRDCHTTTTTTTTNVSNEWKSNTCFRDTLAASHLTAAVTAAVISALSLLGTNAYSSWVQKYSVVRVT